MTNFKRGTFPLDNHSECQLTIEKLLEENRQLKELFVNSEDCNSQSFNLLKLSTRSADSESSGAACQHRSQSKVTVQKVALGRCVCYGSTSREEFLHEKATLKAEMEQRARNYEEKIQELSGLVESLKSQKLVRKYQLTQDDEIKNKMQLIIDATDKTMTMFELDRLAYVTKIEELLRFIKQQTNVEDEKDAVIGQLRVELAIVKEQLLAERRSRRKQA